MRTRYNDQEWRAQVEPMTTSPSNEPPKFKFQADEPKAIKPRGYHYSRKADGTVVAS